MQQSNSNFMNMVQSVLANLRKDQSHWENEPEIAAEVSDVEKEFNSIMETSRDIFGLDPRGYTTAKNDAFDSITAGTHKLCKKMYVYASRHKDSALLSLVDHSLNSLSGGIEKDAVNRCSAIVKRAESMLTVLQPFKITEPELTAIRRLITSYNEHIDGRTNTKTSKSTQIQDVSGQISSLRERLTLLDNLIEGFIDDDEMIARYKTSRAIINYGQSKTSKGKKKGTSDTNNTPS